MQPISTMRSPWKGSRPVVSVSKTISRIGFHSSRRLCGSESAVPPRHCSDRPQDVAHLGAGMIETLRAIHDIVRAPAFFRIRHLFGHDGVEFLFGHARPL